MKKNIVFSMLLLVLGTVVSCSGGSGAGASKSQSIVGVWRTPCEASGSDSERIYYEYQEAGALIQTYVTWENDATCSGEPKWVNEYYPEGFSLGDIISKSPWVQKFDYTVCEDPVYSTIKLQGNKLQVAMSDATNDGSTDELRRVDFSSAVILERVLKTDIPVAPEPVKSSRLCLH